MQSAKLLLILSVLFLSLAAGCASRPSMDELEQEAMQSGDWSAVEQRERMNRRMGLNDPDTACDNNAVLLCGKKGERESCECVSPNVVRPR